MPEFLNLLPPSAALQRLLDQLHYRPVVETVATVDALGRVTAEPVIATLPLPSFARSTVDGYAVRAADTHGASEGLPAYLILAGEVLMGQAPDITLSRGTCALIHTGGMLPAGADAIIMIEHTQLARPGEVELLRAVGGGENVLQIGEDVQAGDVVIPAGRRLRPAEIGGLMAQGQTAVAVARRPRVAILSSGDEVVPPGQTLRAGQVYDVNSHTLAARIREIGGAPHIHEILPDDAAAFQRAAEEALATHDIVVFTAGSSVSVRDLTAETIDALGAPGVLVHGVSVRPGKPTILAVCREKAVIGLPGNPVSALVIADLFVTPVVEAALGLDAGAVLPSISARLAVNLASEAGREDWVPVQLAVTDGDYVATPIFGKSNLIFTLVRADGLLHIPPDANGLAAGARVAVKRL